MQEKKRSTEQQRRKPRNTKVEGWGGQQPPGSRPGGRHKRGETARRAERRETNKTNNTHARRPRAPGAGNQKKPETTGAQRIKKKKGMERRQRNLRDTEGEGRGAATTRVQRTARQETQKGREHTESREVGGQQNKQRTAPRPRAPGAGNQRKQVTKGARGKQQQEKRGGGNQRTKKGGPSKAARQSGQRKK